MWAIVIMGYKCSIIGNKWQSLEKYLSTFSKNTFARHVYNESQGRERDDERQIRRQTFRWLSMSHFTNIYNIFPISPMISGSHSESPSTRGRNLWLDGTWQPELSAFPELAFNCRNRQLKVLVQLTEILFSGQFNSSHWIFLSFRR